MKTKSLSMLALSMIISACAFDEEINELMYQQEETASDKGVFHYTTSILNTKESASSLPYPEALANLNFCIQNQSSNLHLVVEELKLCNVYLSGTYHYDSKAQEGYWEAAPEKGYLSIPIGNIVVPPEESFSPKQLQEIPFIPQIHPAWEPTHHPTNTDGCYLLLSCNIFNIHDTEKGYQENSDIAIWEGIGKTSACIAIPTAVRLKTSQNDTINIILKEGCPWYELNGMYPTLILHPITFDVSVDEWIDGY